MADGNNDDLAERFLTIEPMDFQEEELATSSSSLKDTRFDLIVGHIEDVIMEDEFQEINNGFMEKYYKEFDDTEENKFCYTDIHREYCELVEKYIQKELEARIDQFDMEDFAKQLAARREDLEGEVFEILMTFSDFVTFKEMVLDYRAMKENRCIDLSSGITISHLSVNTTCLEPNFSACEPTPSRSLAPRDGAGDCNGKPKS